MENIPGEQRQLAAQLGMRSWIFSASSNGRGYGDKSRRLPRYLYALFRQLRHRVVAGRRSEATTIELAIYQALSYDYDPAARRCWR